MSNESKLVQSIQADYRRDAAIEREYGSGSLVKGAILKVVVTLVGLAALTDLILTVASA